MLLDSLIFFLPGCNILGTSKANRNRVEESLNAEYEFLINQDLSIDDAYENFLKKRPGRCLAKLDYNRHGIPFRSARCVEQPKESDVSIFFSNVCKFFVLISSYVFLKCNNNDADPEWRTEFQKKMYDAYERALKTEKPVSFTFNGVETTIHPDQLPVDDNTIDIRIADVMKEMKKQSNVSKHTKKHTKKHFQTPPNFFIFPKQTFKVPQSPRPSTSAAARSSTSSAAARSSTSSVSGRVSAGPAASSAAADSRSSSTSSAAADSRTSASSTTKKTVKVTAGKVAPTKRISTEREAPESVEGDDEEGEVEEDEFPELKEKKRLLNAVLKCERKIHDLEEKLLNLHNGEVKYIYISVVKLNAIYKPVFRCYFLGKKR